MVHHIIGCPTTGFFNVRLVPGTYSLNLCKTPPNTTMIFNPVCAPLLPLLVQVRPGKFSTVTIRVSSKTQAKRFENRLLRIYTSLMDGKVRSSKKSKHSYLESRGASPRARRSPNVRRNPSSNLQACAWTFPHPTANELASKASSLPTVRTLAIPCSIARTSFTRIRNNVSVNRLLRTLSTHRMVRSTRPRSTLSNAPYQTRRRNARSLNPAIVSLVKGRPNNTRTRVSLFNILESDLGVLP